MYAPQHELSPTCKKEPPETGRSEKPKRRRPSGGRSTCPPGQSSWKGGEAGATSLPGCSRCAPERTEQRFHHPHLNGGQPGALVVGADGQTNLLVAASVAAASDAVALCVYSLLSVIVRDDLNRRGFHCRDIFDGQGQDAAVELECHRGHR